MFSILIPVYNFNITPLVKELHSQASSCKIAFEIICIDDGSTEEYKLVNRNLKNLSQVYYEELPSNVGRSKIRNLLADKAQYEYLLFLDCDSEITSPHYISNYIESCNKDTVVCGGRSYTIHPPDDSNKYLRWHYGVKREQIDFEVRNRNPLKSFMTNNFLIPKAVFNTIRFNESITGYGHEDTHFGLELKQNKITVQHIDNPLCHIGLEDASEFIAKTKHGIKNLAQLIRANQIDNNIKLYKYYSYFKNQPLKACFLFFFKRFLFIWERHLLSSKPSLWCFDSCKLGWLLTEMEER